MMLEQETGTYSGRSHSHNGYYAGDFSDVPFNGAKLYPPFTPAVHTVVKTSRRPGRDLA